MSDHSRPPRAGKGRGNKAPSTTKLDYSFAPVPRAMLRDPRVSSDSVKLWGILHDLFFQGIPPEIETLQQRMTTERVKRHKDGTVEIVLQPAGRASIFRWLNELEGGGWMRWNRGEDDDHRFELLTGGVEDTATTTVRRLRKLLISGTATIDDVRAILEEIGESQQGDSESQQRDSESHQRDSLSQQRDSESHHSDQESQQRDSNHIYRNRTNMLETASNIMPTHPPADGDDDVPTPTQLFLEEANLGVARELREMPLDMAQRYLSESKGRGASLPVIAKGLRALWQREQARRQEQAAAALPPDWLDAAVWLTLPAELRIALERTEIDDEGYLCYDGRHEAAIAAHEATVKALLAQARREQAVGEIA